MKTFFQPATLTRMALLAAAVSSLAALGCESGGVGDPCIPEDEYNREFSGFSDKEVNVESRSFQCETRVCLVNQFQGRVSCPYGQTASNVTPGADGFRPASASDRCRIPGTTGTDGTNEIDTDAVQVPVPAQFESRRADRAVYCSCRCANAEGKTDDGASYCECPSGFGCQKLVDDVGLGGKQLAGSYCVRDGTDVVETGGLVCAIKQNNCPNEYQADPGS